MSPTHFSLRELPLLVLALATLGCGGGGDFLETAPVTGKVTCQGQPVPPGTITFSPLAEDGKTVPGKVATGQVQADGTFTLTTYEEGDGAIIGRHIVTYAPTPPGEGEDEEDDGESDAAPAPAPAPKAARGRNAPAVPCAAGGKAEVEVVDGDNELTIELSDWHPTENEDDDSDAPESE